MEFNTTGSASQLRIDGTNVALQGLQYLILGVFTDCNRGCPGTAGRVIFNSGDGNLNVDNGCAWIDVATGCTT